MTTAHRPTFDPARGKSAPASHTFHTRSLPAFTHLKYRQRGQDGGDADDEGRPRDLAAELLAAEAAHFAKKSGGKQQQLPAPASVAGGWHPAASGESEGPSGKRELEDGGAAAAGESEDLEAKRRRILELTRAIDADEDEDEESDEDDEGSEKESEEEDDDDEDEDDDSDDDDAELRRELERVRREKQLERERKEREREREEQEARERDIARGNPLLNQPTNFGIKRRWNDDVVFKNQARGTDDKNKQKEFINDMLRSDFHKRFMSKYVR